MAKRIKPLEFHEALSDIIQCELALGNVVAETFHGWADEEWQIVLFAYRFHQRYRIRGKEIKREDVNDPHYWKTEYYHEERKECVACGFDRLQDCRPCVRRLRKGIRRK